MVAAHCIADGPLHTPTFSNPALYSALSVDAPIAIVMKPDLSSQALENDSTALGAAKKTRSQGARDRSSEFIDLGSTDMVR